MIKEGGLVFVTYEQYSYLYGKGLVVRGVENFLSQYGDYITLRKLGNKYYA